MLLLYCIVNYFLPKTAMDSHFRLLYGHNACSANKEDCHCFSCCCNLEAMPERNYPWRSITCGWHLLSLIWDYFMTFFYAPISSIVSSSWITGYIHCRWSLSGSCRKQTLRASSRWCSLNSVNCDPYHSTAKHCISNIWINIKICIKISLYISHAF